MTAAASTPRPTTSPTVTATRPPGSEKRSYQSAAEAGAGGGEIAGVGLEAGDVGERARAGAAAASRSMLRPSRFAMRRS